MIDKTDREILKILQESASTPKAEIARRVGLTPPAVFERVRRLEERGVIRGHVARLDPGALGRGLLAFVAVTEDETLADAGTGSRLAALEGVEEVHRVAGDDGWLLKVRVADPDALAALLESGVRALESVRTVRTSVVLETVAEDQPLPLPPAPDRRHGPPPSEPAGPPAPSLLWAVQRRALAPE